MNNLTLEILMEAHPIYGRPSSLKLKTALHIQKRIEQFVYTNSVKDDSIPISYLRNQPISSVRNLSLTDKSGLVPANNKSLLQSNKYDVVVSTSYSSPYANIYATNQTYVNDKGKVKPLFYRHKLPVDTVEASIYRFEQGNKNLVENGYKIDIDALSIYTSFTNTYDLTTGSAQLYFVSASTSNGETINGLLNAEAVAQEATWEDIDLETGELIDDYPLYTVTPGIGSYHFQFNKGDRWYIRPHDNGLIIPRLPLSLKPDAPWYLRISNGNVSGFVIENGAVFNYRIPEFKTQAFVPYAPIKFGSKEDLLYINRKTLAANRKNLNIEPIEGLHLEIWIQDENENTIKVLTTNTSLSGLRVSNLDVFYETDKIASWDNQSGIVALATEIFPAWTYYAKYYYKADDYEYTAINLNPVINKKLKDHTYIFYVIPNVNDMDRAVHHLVVNPDGVIIETSQSEGLTYPNLQLKNIDGGYNNNTIIGSYYFSEISNNFLDSYGAGFANNYGYMILAEINGIDTSMPENQIDIDVRRTGGIIKPEYYDLATAANPRIIQSILGYGEAGQTVPENNVVILDVPLTTLIEYGGLMTTDQVKVALNTQMPVNGYAHINWTCPKSTLTGSSFNIGSIDINITWEGPLIYNLYRRQTVNEPWALINSWINPVEGTITYTDINVTSGLIYEYAVTITENDIEFPHSEELIIKAR